MNVLCKLSLDIQPLVLMVTYEAGGKCLFFTLLPKMLGKVCPGDIISLKFESDNFLLRNIDVCATYACLQIGITLRKCKE